MTQKESSALRFLSIGECMAELAPLGAPDDFRLGFAGDTFNTAWYLRQLRPDADVTFLSVVGCDGISDRMVEFMQDAGIATGHVARCAQRSVGLYLITLNEGERSFSYWRDTSAARLLADDVEALQNAAAGADLIYFSGITLAILAGPAQDRLLQVLGSARSAGKTIAFDPNLRPRLWSDADHMTQTIMRGAAVSDIVLPSFEDEAGHFGDADPQATARRFQSAGASTVVVKNGPEPVHYVHGGQSGDVSPTPVANVVDTTSAGDSFNAALFAAMGGTRSLENCIRQAAAVAGQVVGGKGALVTLDPSGPGFDMAGGSAHSDQHKDDA